MLTQLSQHGAAPPAHAHAMIMPSVPLAVSGLYLSPREAARRKRHELRPHFLKSEAARELETCRRRLLAATQTKFLRDEEGRAGAAVRKQQWKRRATGSGSAGAQHTSHCDFAVAGRRALGRAVGTAPLFLHTCEGATYPRDGHEEIRPADRSVAAMVVVLGVVCSERMTAAASPVLSALANA